MTIDKIRKALKDRRLSSISRQTGLHQNTIAKIRDGVTSDPSLETIEKLTGALFDAGNNASSALDLLSRLEEAANYAWEVPKTFPPHIHGNCTISILPDGLNVSCRLVNRDIDPDAPPAASHRMISYHAVEAAKINILIDAVDAVVDQVLEFVSEEI